MRLPVKKTEKVAEMVAHPNVGVVNVLSVLHRSDVATKVAAPVQKSHKEEKKVTDHPKGVLTRPTRKKRSEKPSREERGYGARGPKKTDDWQQFFKDKEPDFSEEGWARRKPK